jgi:hypothetical protein
LADGFTLDDPWDCGSLMCILIYLYERRLYEGSKEKIP